MNMSLTNYRKNLILLASLAFSFAAFVLQPLSHGEGASISVHEEGTAQGTVHSFKIKLVSRMTLEVESKKQLVTAETEMEYKWQRKERQRTLTVDSLLVQANVDGVDTMNTFMSRTKFRNIQQGKTNEIAAQTAPDRLKAMLQESFGLPICTLELDAQGKEIKRSVVAGAGAKNIVDNGVIANSLLFHPPFFPEKNEWSTETELSMGQGGYAKGKLSYTNLAGGQPLQTCKVAGTLTSDRFKRPNSPITVSKARYLVTGEQQFDPVLKEWVSGRLMIDVSNQLMADEKSIGSNRGEIAVSFERVAAANKPD